MQMQHVGYSTNSTGLFSFQLVHAAEVFQICQTVIGHHVLQMGTVTTTHVPSFCPVQQDILPVEQPPSRSPAIPTENGVHLQDIVKVISFFGKS